MSQHFMFTPPFFTIFTFSPMVGTVSTAVPIAITFNSVVFPLRHARGTRGSTRTEVSHSATVTHRWRALPHLFSRPTSTTSRSLDQNTPNSFDKRPPMVPLHADAPSYPCHSRRRRRPLSALPGTSVTAQSLLGQRDATASGHRDPRSLAPAHTQDERLVALTWLLVRELQPVAVLRSAC